MTNLKNLLFSSILCSLVLLNACSEEDAAAIEAASKATLSVTASPSEGGSVSPQGGTYDAGTTVELTATSNVDYTFTGWTGDFEGSSNPVTLTMLNDQTLTANFEFQDADGDGVGDSVDNCAETSSGATVDENGCADSQKDTDGDGVTDDVDICPASLEGETVDENGCAGSQKDTDGDGVSDDLDICPQSEEGADVNDSGCNNDAIYLDENGVTMKATEDAIIGESYNYQNTTYLIVDESTLRQMIVANEDVSKVITSRVTNLFELFKDNSSFNQDISSWDVSNVTSMQNLFLSATSFNQDISSWDVGNVNTMRSTFNSAASFNQDISSWDVSNVGNMRAMFAASFHTTIFNQDIVSWDVSNVVDMSYMFSLSPFNQDIGNWDVSSVTQMNGMFQEATSFNQDIGNWDVSNVISTASMFFKAASFNQDIGAWDVSSVFQMTGMFAESSFNQNIGSWDVSSVHLMNGMFDTSPFNQDIGNWDVSNATVMAGMFWLATEFNQDISSWNVSNVTDMSDMFRSSYDGTNYESSFNQDLSSWNVDNVVNYENFSLDASNWTEPKPNFINDNDATAFLNATGIIDLDISSAIKNLVSDLKAYGIWNKMIAIYPMVGGTSTTQKYNLIDPRDDDGAFRLTYGSSVTHSLAGFTPSGTNNGSAYTRIQIDSDLSQNNVYCSVYIGTNVAEDRLDFGAISSQNGIQLASRNLSNTFNSKMMTNINKDVGAGTTTDSRGFLQISRTSSTGYTMQKGTTKGFVTETSIAPPPEWIALGGIGTSKTTANAISSKVISFAAFGSGLTISEMDDMYTAVQAFQTILGRNF